MQLCGLVAAPRTRRSDSVGCCFISGEGVLAGQGVDATDGVVQDDATEARSDGAAHVERLPAGSTPWPNADHATRPSMICVGLGVISSASIISALDNRWRHWMLRLLSISCRAFITNAAARRKGHPHHLLYPASIPASASPSSRSPNIPVGIPKLLKQISKS
jgi:hypothetical protein